MSLFEQASLCITPNGTKASKLYAIKPTDASGDLSVTRATTATRVNSSGLIESVATNVPRLDYTNSTCPSILVEPQRTNLLTYSEDFTNAGWNKFQATITANSIVSPDGNTTADRLTSSANGSAVLFRVASTGAAVATLSVYAKAGTNDILDIGFTNVTDFTVKANLTTGTIVSATSGITGTITNVGNGWYRVTATRTMTTSGTLFINSATNISGRFLNIWGAQLEAGSYATSYIPSVASSVTRNADVISKTGISSLIGQTEGTLFVDLYASSYNADGTQYSLISFLGDSNENVQLYTDNSLLRYNIKASGENDATTGVIFSNNNRYKISISYKSGDCVVYVNGVLRSTSNKIVMPVMSALYINQLNTGSYIAKNNFNTVALWKTRLTNTELATLTTI